MQGPGISEEILRIAVYAVVLGLPLPRPCENEVPWGVCVQRKGAAQMNSEANSRQRKGKGDTGIYTMEQVRSWSMKLSTVLLCVTTPESSREKELNPCSQLLSKQPTLWQAGTILLQCSSESPFNTWKTCTFFETHLEADSSRKPSRKGHSSLPTLKHFLSISLRKALNFFRGKGLVPIHFFKNYL